MKVFNIILIISFFIFSCSSNKSSNDNAIYVNVGPEPKTIDPSLNSSLDGNLYIQHIFEGLASRDKNNQITYGTADYWEMSEDALTYTFHIRSNAKWSDGKNVVADDFVYAWRRVVDPNTASEESYMLEVVSNAIDITLGKKSVEELGIRAIDDNTLEVKLQYPTPHFLELVSCSIYFPLRKDVIEANGDKWTLSPETYICNGPFMMTDRKTDENITIEKNTNYWNIENIVPNKIVFVLINNEASIIAGIKDGSLHFAKNPPSQEIDSLKKDGLIYTIPLLGTYYYSFNMTNEIFKDVRVRKALSLAIDRNYIVESVTKAGHKPAGAWIPFGFNVAGSDFREAGGDYYSIKPEDYAKNVEEAKRLLEEAGYKNGENFPVIDFKSNSGEHIQIFEAVQQIWKENLNIDSVISQEEWSSYLTTLRDKNFMMARQSLITPYNDPMNAFSLFLSYSSQNNISYSNANYDNQLKISMSSANITNRINAMHKAEDIFMNDMPIIPIYFYSDPIMISKKLKDVVFDTMGTHKFFYARLEN